MIELLLVNARGDIVKRYLADRYFGNIEHDGRRYRSQHLRGRPEIYLEVEQ